MSNQGPVFDAYVTIHICLVRVNSLITHLQRKKMLVMYKSAHAAITFQLLEMSSITTPNQTVSNVRTRYIFQRVFLGKILAILLICIIKINLEVFV